jgi:hypothetical protein
LAEEVVVEVQHQLAALEELLHQMLVEVVEK